MAEVFITLDNIQDYNPKKRYTIVADYIVDGKLATCLVSPVASPEIYKRMLVNPNKYDLITIKDGTNLRMHEVEPEKCWWDYGTN
jgi:hypothetical protein